MLLKLDVLVLLNLVTYLRCYTITREYYNNIKWKYFPFYIVNYTNDYRLSQTIISLYLFFAFLKDYSISLKKSDTDNPIASIQFNMVKTETFFL